MVYMEATKPQPINWFPSYSSEAKIPMGTYVLFNLLEDKLTEVNTPPFEALQDSTMNGTYLFINDHLNFEKAELERLMGWAEKGNDVFMSASSFGNKLLDTLNIETTQAFLLHQLGTQPMLNLVNENLKAVTPYHIQREMRLSYFNELDTLQQTVLGVAQPYNDTLKITKPEANFIEAPVGKGNFYLHMQPEVFTNYFLLEENNATYTQNTLSYINRDGPILWDRYYKTGKPQNISPLYILLNNKYLKWAYYLVLIGALFFVLFEGKRKQRSIPIVKPLENKTFDYTQTISGMYYDKKQYREIANKQIVLFLEFIRTRLRIPTERINARFLNSVAARSGNDLETTTALFTLIEKIENQSSVTENELIHLHKEIRNFKSKLDGKS